MAEEQITEKAPSAEEGAGDETDGGHDESEQGANLSNPKSTYRQKYKPAWELDTELRDWLTACSTDTYAAYCRYCRTKLHAHKKGLLAHAKSAKHKKHVLNPEFPPDAIQYIPHDSFSGPRSNGDVEMSIEPFDGGDRAQKRNLRGDRLFKDEWLKDPMFSAWVRKFPRNNTRAICIACRCMIKAGRSELVTHTKAAKHKKATGLNQTFEEITDAELDRLEMAISSHDPNTSMVVQPAASQQQVEFRPSVVDLPGMLVDEIIRRLNEHVPLDLAEKWDNVGIITKPTQPIKVYSVLLTIDLNERIVEEAIKKRVQFIISYHPPIFTPIKNLDSTSRWMNKALVMCIEHRITVYSPHTALDAIKGGINDWLISSFISGENNKIRPIQHSRSTTNTACLEVLLSETQENVAQAFKDINNFTMTGYDNASTDVKVSCNNKTLPEVLEQLEHNKFSQLCSRVIKLDPMPLPGIGMGRMLTFGHPMPLYEVLQRTKTHLDLSYVRLALSPKHNRDTRVKTLAVCAGSGSSVLKGCVADVWITGEMSHHEVLDAINSGISVILCEHSNTERGFLRDWSQQLRSVVFEDQVFVTLSELDKDPLRIV